MKKEIIFFGAVVLFSITAPSGVFAQTGDIIQINNLTVESVSAGEVVASRSENAACTRFDSLNAKTGLSGLCPLPPVASSAYPHYRITVTGDAKLLLRAREQGALSDFEKGDRINVFGIYAADGSLSARIMRNLTKPLARDYIQLLDLEVAAITVSGTDTVLFAIQRADGVCQSFAKGWKENVVCPIGISSPNQSSFLSSDSLPASVKSQLNFVRKYEVKITSKTTVLDRNKNPLPTGSVAPGDIINVYGSHTEKDALRVEAEVARDLSRPASAGNEAGTYEGLIAQINQSEGSFVIRLRDGKRILVPPYFRVDHFVRLKGELDETGSEFSEVSEIVIQKISDVDPIPAINYINPGYGIVGTEVELVGSGFTPTGNSIAIDGVQGVVSGLLSPDGKTLKFVIPATLCISGTACSLGLLPYGNHDISVMNKNGVSNAVSFSVSLLPPLTIVTPSLPQGIENNRYTMTVDARGGAGTYEWQVVNGTLPPGLQIAPGTCSFDPCRAPLTIKGVPTSPGSYTFTLVLKSRNETTSKLFTLVIVQEISKPF